MKLFITDEVDTEPREDGSEGRVSGKFLKRLLPERKPKPVKDDSPVDEEFTGWKATVVRQLQAFVRGPLPYLLIVALVVVVFRSPAESWAWLKDHPGGLAWVGVIVLPPLVWTAINYQRMSIIRDPKRAGGRQIRMTLRPYGRALAEWVDVLVFKDTRGKRIAYAVATVIAVVGACTLSVDSAALYSGTPSEEDIQTTVIAAALPVLWLVFISVSMASVTKQRISHLSVIHEVAAANLKYPKPASRPRLSDLQLRTWWSAVRVEEWGSLYEPRKFFVRAPMELSVSDEKAWQEFEVNLNAKVPLGGSGWHIGRAPDGSGATIEPANYPLAVQWEGQYAKDPLTFELGVDLDEGRPYLHTFGAVSPHFIVTGGTSSGKSSLAEVVAAQVLVKPMPWDPDLRGTIDVVDPKGPFANRWQGRPGVTVSNGATGQGLNEAGDMVSGFELMAAHCEAIEKEHQRRAAVLAKYPDAGTWIDLPDSVKKSERLAPKVIIMDEYLDHTSNEKANGNELVERENAARDRITYLATWWARKTRNVGIHLIYIMQSASMNDIGGQLKRNAAGRTIMGQMDQWSYQGMFGTADVPFLPTSRRVVDESSGKVVQKTIPGRGLILNAPGQPIHRVQVYWFGGSTNTDMLDRLLPRSADRKAGLFGLEEHAEIVSSLPDEDNNGIPDAWETGQATPPEDELDLGLPDMTPAPRTPPKPTAENIQSIFPAAPVQEVEPPVEPTKEDTVTAEQTAWVHKAGLDRLLDDLQARAERNGMTLTIGQMSGGLGVIIRLLDSDERLLVQVTRGYTADADTVGRTKTRTVYGQASSLELVDQTIARYNLRADARSREAKQ